jgi:LuxR family maltose regulon positive regulatory protein
VATVEGGQDATERIAPSEGIVLETKLTPPPVRSEHVPRLALLAILRASASHRLTLLAAPPGFGKTTLLAEWVSSEARAAIAWLSLDEGDNDPARFFAYLTMALRRIEPAIGGRALASLRTPGADFLKVVLPLLLNDLAGLDRDLVLVVEDYHLITNSEIHETLSYLIERLPGSLRLVLSTREDPPFPLGRLRAGGELGEIRAGDLRFSDAETAGFLTEALGLKLSDEDVARLHARTEGWPAALYLAALSLRGRTDASALIERFAGDDRYMVDYLMTEVLDRQPIELRSFLLQTSILKRFSAPLCDAVTQREGSAALLTDLEHSNLLLVPLDTKREWYRYHHLFGELLRHELATVVRGALPDLHRRASAWYRNAGLIADAADHATAAGDFDTAVELAARHYADFVGQGQLATVLRWLDALPMAVAEEDWLLCFAGGVVTAHAGLLDEAERWLERAERAPARPRDGQLPAAPLAALAGYLRLLRGDIGGTIVNTRRALAVGPADDPIWALAPQMVLAPALWWAGEATEARTILEMVTRTAEAAGIPATIVYSLGIRAAIALDMQDELLAETLDISAIELMHRAELDEHPWAAMAHIVHGTLLARHHDLAAAAEEIELGLDLGERQRAWQLIAHASLALAEVRGQQREADAARRLLTRVRDLLGSIPDPGDGLSRLERTEKTLRLRAGARGAATQAPYWELSGREIEVLRLLPSHLSQREIAAELYISFNTIRTHTRVIFRKLGVESRPEAVARARELGLL